MTFLLKLGKIRVALIILISLHMALDERKIRLEKLEKIREQGLDPYPSRFDKKNSLKQAYEAKLGAKVKTAGRLMTIRDMGKLCFCHLMDESQKMQIALQADKIGQEEYDWFVKNLDMGDFIGVEGEVFKTHKGELSILVSKYTLLTKAIRPLPEKWHGLVDEELKLRKRYLDFISHPELKELFYRKAKFWQTTREFLLKEGFLEVETPVLETTVGGADAEPFITHHNALDLDVYLRISTGELWQKRLMVAGFEKTFEIGRQFRNEGMSKEHLQDYTQMECYWAYADFNDMMALVEKMYKKIIKETYGQLKFEIAGFTVDFDKEWPKIDYVATIKKDFDLDVIKATKEALVKKLKELRVDFDANLSKPRLTDVLWKQVRKTIAGPAFLINHPVEVSPLAKRDPKDKTKVQRFQIILAGSEMGNGYSELNDPVDQAERFEEQAKMRAAGDKEAQMPDQDFVEALEYGMPPTAGFGFSERLFSFLENKTMRECQIFPLMKPEK
ncbi:MAG: lysine--tRNA ligase [Candidatus Parcubacteria bacterium]|nr:lysine--tRNA ligase [Candidatus Parcubacteria bacterium]